MVGLINNVKNRTVLMECIPMEKSVMMGILIWGMVVLILKFPLDSIVSTFLWSRQSVLNVYKIVIFVKWGVFVLNANLVIKWIPLGGVWNVAIIVKNVIV